MENGKLPNAVILGLVPHPRSISTIRSLGRAGIKLVGFDHIEPPHRVHTRFLKPRNCSILSSPGAVLKALLDGAAEAGSVLFPTSDEYLILISRNYDRLSERYIISCPPWRELQQVVNIARCYDLARKCGIATPEYYVPKNDADLAQVIESLDCESRSYLVRTMPGDAPANPESHRYTRVAGKNKAEILATCQEIKQRTGLLPTIVEVVPGQAKDCLGVTLVMARNSDPVVAYGLQRLTLYTYRSDRCRAPGAVTHPYELGALVYCESRHDSEALDKAIALAKAAGFYGTVTIEFRRNVANGQLTLIKCDPRVVRATSLSTALGVDVPTALYRTFIGSSSERKLSIRDGVGWLWFSQFVEALWDNRHEIEVRHELLNLFPRIWRIRSFAFVSITDPLPFFTHLYWRLCDRLRIRRAVRQSSQLRPTKSKA
jgi:predicted ATP-grasp superfamily ATP-dependent carboligase